MNSLRLIGDLAEIGQGHLQCVRLAIRRVRGDLPLDKGYALGKVVFLGRAGQNDLVSLPQSFRRRARRCLGKFCPNARAMARTLALFISSKAWGAIVVDPRAPSPCSALGVRTP